MRSFALSSSSFKSTTKALGNFLDLDIRKFAVLTVWSTNYIVVSAPKSFTIILQNFEKIGAILCVWDEVEV